MENSTQSEEQLAIIQTIETFKPISEITSEYKKLNDDLITAMEIFERIFKFEKVEKEDIEDLKKIILVFNDYNFNHEGYKIYGSKLKENTLKTTLMKSYEKSMVFFNSEYCYQWYIQYDKFKLKLFEINDFIDFTIPYFVKLRTMLRNNYFQMHDAIEPPEDKKFKRNEFLMKFNVIEYIEIGNEKSNLKERKEFFIKAISNANMYKIINIFSVEEEIFYNCFIQKCIEAIKIIEFEMIANHLPIDETIKLFENNNTSLNQKIEEEINTFQPDIAVVPSNPTQVEEEAPNMLKSEKSNQSTTEIKPVKTFPEYLLHTQNEKLAEALKKQFSTGKGKTIWIMIEALKQTDPQMLTLNYGENSAFFTALEKYFSRKIGTYASVFNSSFDKTKEKSNIDNAITKINHVLTTLHIQE